MKRVLAAATTARRASRVRAWPLPIWPVWSPLTSSGMRVRVTLSKREYYSRLSKRRRSRTREESGELMKTMTCKQLGGPCNHQHQAQTADEAIQAQDQHLKEMVGGGDTTHAPALKEMKGRWKHPISGMGWYRAAKKDFAQLPEA